MQRVQEYYMDELGLGRIDADPPPNPDNMDEISWRMDRIRKPGASPKLRPVYIGAFTVKGSIPGSAFSMDKSDDAMKGLLVLNKPDGPCGESPLVHRPTEIVEWDVAEEERGKRLGRTLLQQGLSYMHPEDKVQLDVAETNQLSQDIYAHYGFSIREDLPSRGHGVFDTRHIPMEADGIDVFRALT
jgi:hypothetical protein